MTRGEDDLLFDYNMTDLGGTTFLESFPSSNWADDASFPFWYWPGPAVRGFARRDVHCVTLVLVILLNRFVLQKFDLSSLFFLLGVIDAVARLQQELARKQGKHTWERPQG